MEKDWGGQTAGNVGIKRKQIKQNIFYVLYEKFHKEKHGAEKTRMKNDILAVTKAQGTMFTVHAALFQTGTPFQIGTRMEISSTL